MAQFISFPGLAFALLGAVIYGFVVVALAICALVCLTRGRRCRGAFLLGVILFGLIMPNLLGAWQGRRIEAQVQALSLRPENIALDGERLLLICRTCGRLAEAALKGGRAREVYSYTPFSTAQWQPGQGAQRVVGGEMRLRGAFWRWQLVPDPLDPGQRHGRMERVETLPDCDVTLLDVSLVGYDAAAMQVLGIDGEAAGALSEGVFVFTGGMPLAQERLVARLPYADHQVRMLFLPFERESRRIGDWPGNRAALRRWLCGDPHASGACEGI